MTINKIKTINPQVCKELRVTIENQLRSLEKDLGIKFALGNASFDDDTIKFGFKVSLATAKNKDEKTLLQDIEFRKQFDQIQLDTTKIVSVGRMKATLIGKRLKAKKPYIIKDLDTSKQYVLTEEACEKYFGISN
jgi:hypothetical protein|tara:strand:- start:57 stop:461 length:405 start_codon:yes stop_codon:yes gene_type:complete